MPTALPGFHLAVFGTPPQGVSKPDSLVIHQNHVWIGYGNGVPPDGSSGSSNIVEYTLDGKPLLNLTIAGHNDGLRLDPRTGLLWAVQNEDATPTLVLIDPRSGAQTAPAPLPVVNGGGYDDPAFLGGDQFISASNPALDANGNNTSPALVRVHHTASGYTVTPVLAGNATAVNVFTGQRVTLNLTDPDSLIPTPTGDLLLDDQGDGQLILIRMHAASGPRVIQIPLLGGVQVDDTTFATTSSGTLFISDTAANTVYTLRSDHFDAGKPYSAGTGVPATTTTTAIPAAIGRLFLDSGAFLPIATGFSAPHGMVFMPAMHH